MTLGVDYSSVHPASAVASCGNRFVVRYLTGSLDPRGLTPAEIADLKAHGLAIALVYETTTTRMLSGYAAGYVDAQAAQTTKVRLGIPANIPVYFACDFDANVGQRTWDGNVSGAIAAYLNGCSAAMGKYLVGIYGSIYVVDYALSHSLCAWGWQTYAWSGGKVSTRAHLLQYNIYASCSGFAVDLDRSLKADFGQWPRPPLPIPDTSTGYGLPGWPAYAQTYIGACGYAYRIFVNAGKAPASATTGHWGASGWPSYARYSFTSASQYALRIFKNNPKYRP